MKSKLIKSLPHFVAVVLFLTISITFFSPLINGYSLVQHDIQTYLGMSKEFRDFKEVQGEYTLWTNSMFGGMPAYQVSTISEGNWVVKTNKILKLGFTGPIGTLFMAMLGFYILTLCLKIKPWIGIVGSIGFGLASIFILYLGAGHVSKMNALGYMAPVLGGMILTLRGEYLKGAALTSMFLSLHLSMNHLQMTYYLIFLLLFVGIAYGIQLIIQKKTKQLIIATGVLVGAALLGAMPSTSNLLPTKEYSEYTTRGESDLTVTALGEDKKDKSGLDRDYILEYNFGSGELFSIVVPNVKGGNTEQIKSRKNILKKVDRNYRKMIGGQSTYWGEQRFTGGAFYFGAVIILLAFMGMFVIKNPIKWALLGVITLSMILALKDYGMIGDFFINKMPLFNKFRDTKMMLVLAQISFPILAVLFLDEIFKSKENLSKIKKPILISGGVFALFFIISYLSPSLFFDFEGSQYQTMFDALSQQTDDENLILNFMDELVKTRQFIFKDDLLRSLIFILTAFGLIVVYTFGKLKEIILIPILGVLILIDLYGVDRRYLSIDKKGGKYEKFEKTSVRLYPFKASIADLSILNQEKGKISDFDNQVNAIEKRKSENISKADLRKNKEIIHNSAAFGVLGLNSNYRVLKVGSITQDAKTSFFHKSLGGYHGAKLKRYQELIDFHLGKVLQKFSTIKSQADFDNIMRDASIINMLNPKYIILNDNSPAIPNTYAYGNAWFVDQIQTVQNADEEITNLNKINLRNKALVDVKFTDMIINNSLIDSTAKINLIEYNPNHLIYESNSTIEKNAIFSEIYYEKGWKAFVDGQETPIFRANYVLRGIKVPAGQHSIEFIFDPQIFKTSVSIATIGSFLVFLLIGAALFFEAKKLKSDLDLHQTK